VLVAPDFVSVALGQKWIDAVPVIRLLALVGLLQTLQFLNPAVLQALDRTSLLFRWTLVSYAAAVIAFVIGLQWGIVGVAAAFLVAASITEPTFAWITGRLVGVGLRRLARDLAGVGQATILMAAAVLITRISLLEAGVAAAARLGTEVVVGALVYVGACYWREPAVVDELRRLRSAPRTDG
jgi:O-antigen/teichoic acid export membrane protein